MKKKNSKIKMDKIEMEVERKSTTSSLGTTLSLRLPSFNVVCLMFSYQDWRIHDDPSHYTLATVFASHLSWSYDTHTFAQMCQMNFNHPNSINYKGVKDIYMLGQLDPRPNIQIH